MELCSVDVHRMSPCRDIFVVLADETIAMAASAAFLSSLVFVSDQEVAGQRSFVFQAHLFFRGVFWSSSQAAMSAISCLDKVYA